MRMAGPQIVPVSALDVLQAVVMAIDVHIHIVTLQGSMSAKKIIHSHTLKHFLPIRFTQ